jgi:hypothetical protein
MDNLEKIGGKAHMGDPKEEKSVASINANIKEETQIEQLLDMAWRRLASNLFLYSTTVALKSEMAKARIAQLETDKAILRRMILELRKEIGEIREIVREKK